MPQKSFSLLRRLLNRRRLLTMGFATVGGAMLARGVLAQTPDDPHASLPGRDAHGGNQLAGSIDHSRNGFDPMQLLREWETGRVSSTSDGRRIREFSITVIEREIEIAPGVKFPAWTYNGRVPGPSLRATEGDLIRIEFTNAGSHDHSIHFHGIHAARMDGVPGAGQVAPGETFIYEFEAKPFGCHLYHCHTFPLKRHLHKGLYGAFIIDPDPARHPENAAAAKSRLLGAPENAAWQEFIMVMNGFDTNFDDENEFYAINSIAFAYQKAPIPLEKDRPVRIYLINVTEFDPINSLHLHGNFFDYFDQGTSLTPTTPTIDTVMQCQAQRGILEFSFANHEPGRYMFHGHQSEFAELGWMATFDVA